MPQKPISNDSAADEQQWQDRLEAEENEGCNQDHSATGMCPCCGVELEELEIERWTGKYRNVLLVESQQKCPSCHWMSAHSYDS